MAFPRDFANPDWVWGRSSVGEKLPSTPSPCIRSVSRLLKPNRSRHGRCSRFVLLRCTWRCVMVVCSPRLLSIWGCSIALLLHSAPITAQAHPSGVAPKVVVETDGTVHVPAQTVPMSPFLSPEARAYVTQHLKDMQNPEILKQDAGVPRFMKGYLARDYELFAVEKKDEKVGGVHAYV